jgi:hypothetical protein
LSGLRAALGGLEAASATLAQVRALLGMPGVRQVVDAAATLPQGGVQLRAPDLPGN